MKFVGLLLCIVALLPAGSYGQSVQLKGLFGSSAMLQIDGTQRILKPGQQSPEGVRLLEATSEFARVSIDGREQKLTLNAPIASAYAKAQQAEVRLNADGGGHYSTHAWINGRRVNVLVDTGATSIAFNYPTARRLGISLDNAKEIRVSTASGIARAYRVKLASVAIGGIKIHNVDATVHADNFPEITLLGNSFLRRVDMEQQGGLLILRARQ